MALFQLINNILCPYCVGLCSKLLLANLATNTKSKRCQLCHVLLGSRVDTKTKKYYLGTYLNRNIFITEPHNYFQS